jgi:hypothetical protein
MEKDKGEGEGEGEGVINEPDFPKNIVIRHNWERKYYIWVIDSPDITKYDFVSVGPCFMTLNKAKEMLMVVDKLMDQYRNRGLSNAELYYYAYKLGLTKQLLSEAMFGSKH